MSDSESHFLTICPLCSSMLKVRRAYLGHTIACKKCGHSFVGVEADQSSAFKAGAKPSGKGADPGLERERILVVCGNCNASLSIKRSRIGQVIRCKQCDQEFRVQPPGDAMPSLLAAFGAPPLAAGARSAFAVFEKSDAQHDLLRSRNAALQSEHEKLAVEHSLLEAEADRLRDAHAAVVAENQRLSEERDSLSQELSAARNAAARAEMERQAAAVEIDQHRADADRERALQQAEIERLLKTLQLERDEHQQELVQRTREVAELSDRQQWLQNQFELCESARKEFEDRNRDAVEAHSQLEADLRSKLIAERLRQAQLEEQLRLLQDEASSLKESLAAVSSSRSKAPEPQPAGPAAENELESARAEILRLRDQLEQLERLQREITSTLNALGLTVQVG